MGLELLYTSEEQKAYAEAIGKGLGISCRQAEKGYTSDELHLLLDDDGLALCKDKLKVMGDFSQMKKRLMYNNLTHEMLVKASKFKGMQEGALAVDATAGLGEDSLLLAAAGFRVILFERDPVIAALLRDSLRRGLLDDELKAYVARMELIEGDSVIALRQMKEAPEVIYLDPMFPERQKSGLIKKKFQLLQLLESPCTDGEELVQAAIEAGPRRVVIKRPLKAEQLAGVKPSYSLEGKAIRYDILVYAKE